MSVTSFDELQPLFVGAYDFREDGEGWCVYDCRSGEVVSLRGRQQTGLHLEEADELASALSRAATLQRVHA